MVMLMKKSVPDKSASDVMDEGKGYAAKGNWDAVDKKIVPALSRCKPREVLPRVLKFYGDTNGDVRDFAATAAATIDSGELTLTEHARLQAAFRAHLSDPHFYAAFRTVVAAMKTELYEESDVEVMRCVLAKAAKDKDVYVSKLASKYLKRLS